LTLTATSLYVREQLAQSGSTIKALPVPIQSNSPQNAVSFELVPVVNAPAFVSVDVNNLTINWSASMTSSFSNFVLEIKDSISGTVLTLDVTVVIQNCNQATISTQILAPFEFQN
jgi:hypothetical protein